MNIRRALLPLLLALSLLLGSCGKTEAYQPPDWVASYDLAAESARVLQLLTTSGADDASLAELQVLLDRTGDLPYYFFSSYYTGGDRDALTEYVRTARMIYEMMLQTQESAWSWQTISEQLKMYLEMLSAAQVANADPRFVPRFEQTPEADPYYALLACFLRARYVYEQKNNIVSITFGGDTTFGDVPDVEEALSLDARFSSLDGDLSFPLSLIAPYLRTDSYTVLNCEGTFTNATEPRTEQPLRGSPGYASMFSACSVDAVNLANEHTLDYFETGFADTKTNLANAGVATFGGAESLLVEADGVQLGLLGYDLTAGQPEGFAAQLERDITALRGRGAQLIIPVFHWGELNSSATTAQQTEVAHLAVDLGADMVVGHHPHALQGMEVYNGKTIVYSLGDLVVGGGAAINGSGYAMLVRQTFQKNSDGTLTPQPPMVLPAYVSSQEGGNNFTPRPALGNASDHITRLLFKLSRTMEFGIKEFGSVA